MENLFKQTIILSKSFEDLDIVFPKRIGEYYRIYLKGFNSNEIINEVQSQSSEVVVYLHSDISNIKKGQAKGITIQINKSNEAKFYLSNLNFKIKDCFLQKIENIEDIVKIGKQCWTYYSHENGVSANLTELGLETLTNQLINELKDNVSLG